MLEHKNFNNSDRSYLYSKLLIESKLGDKVHSIEENINEYFCNLVKDYILAPEIRNIYKNAIRIARTREGITIHGSELGLCDNKNYFPDKKYNIPDFDPNKNYIVNFCHSFDVEEFPDLMIYCKYDKLNEGTSIDWYINNLVPENKLSILKDLFIELMRAKYDYSNFLSDYIKKGYRYSKVDCFLATCRTWGNVKKINKDWFDILTNGITVEEKIQEDKEKSAEELLQDLKIMFNQNKIIL